MTRWSSEEVSRLKALVPDCPASVVAVELGRSLSSVKVKARALGLRFRNGQKGRPKDWSVTEENTLREMAPTSHSGEIAAVLGVSAQAVRTYASRKKIRLRGGKPGPKKVYWNWLEHV